MILRWGMRAVDVLVVGGGPVGMLATHLLAERGVSVLAIDQRPDATEPRYSVLLHPASVRRLAKHGFDPTPLGHSIERLAYYSGPDRVAECGLDDAGLGAVVALPQHRLQEVMDATVDVERGVTMNALRVASSACSATASDGDGPEQTVRARFVVGADGVKSRVREAMKATFVEHGVSDRYVLAEVTGAAAFPGELRYGLDEHGVSAAWPLPDHRTRLNIVVPADATAPEGRDALREFVRDRAPWCEIDIDVVDWCTATNLEDRLTDRFVKHGVVVAGDAAHSANPIPAMSLNLGLAEATTIADAIAGRGVSDAREALAEGMRAFVSTGADLFGGEFDAPAWIGPHAKRVRASVPAFGDDAAALLRALQSSAR